MPIYEISCDDCGFSGEIIIVNSGDALVCPQCNSKNTARLMSPTSSLTGKTVPSVPGPGDTSCCGSSPSQAGCAGPGSCCGKNI
ncbi:MAG: zinc ribbon domain-containing protein [Desulfobacterales bacterium]|nr:zinc ribbon domain-containing protein [Desulfobacterales bacterium]